MIDIEATDLNCNETCCQMSSGNVMCFNEYNFTDRANITYPETWELALRWTYAPLIMLVAVLGNLAIIIILAKNRLLLRTSVNYFILNMSVADLITGLAGPIPFTIRDTAYFWVFGEAWCHLEGYIQVLVMMVSVTSLAVISCDRMMGVVRPFHNHIKPWQSIAIIFIIWTVSALLAVPFAVYRIYTVHHWQDLDETTCGEDVKKMHVWWMINMIGLTWLPLLVMIVCYTTILVYFRTHKFKASRNKEHPALTHLKRRVVLMMFVVVVAFTICWLPFQLLKICNNLFLDDNTQFKNEKARRSHDILLTLSHYMMYTNAAINPIIYALMHQTFRRAFRVTFPCFYNHKSMFVLTRGEGRQNYVWSMRSTSIAYNNVMSMGRDHLSDRSRRAREHTPTAVVCSAALAASIVIEPIMEENMEGNSEQDSGQTQLPDSHVVSANTELRGSPPAPRSPSLGNERYVRDLVPRRIPIVSTGALGHLITQVIEEETSSDLESERIL